MVPLKMGSKYIMIITPVDQDIENRLGRLHARLYPHDGHKRTVVFCVSLNIQSSIQHAQLLESCATPATRQICNSRKDWGSLGSLLLHLHSAEISPREKILQYPLSDSLFLTRVKNFLYLHNHLERQITEGRAGPVPLM